MRRPAHGRRARAGDRATPRRLAPEVGRPRVVLPERAGTASRATHPVRVSHVPRAGPELGLDQVDAIAAAGLAVEQAGRIDLVRRARLGAGDEQGRRARPGPRSRRTTGPRVDGGADKTRRLMERGHRPAAGVVAHERAPQGSGRGERGGRRLGSGVRVVAVAHPDADDETRMIAVGRRRQVAVRRQVARLVRRPGLDRSRPIGAALAVVERELCRPDRVLLLVGVAGQDVGDLVGGLRRDGLRAGRIRRLPDDRAVRPLDLEDHLRRQPVAAVGQPAVGRGEVERSHLDRPDRAGESGLQVRLPAAGEPDAECLGRLVDLAVADPLEGPDGRDVERVLEGLADEDRAALELVGVPRHPVLPRVELGRDVEQQAARRQLVAVERAGVQDRLPRRARLPGAIAGDVELGLELGAGEVVAVVAGAAGVGEDVAGRVVHRDQRAVVQVLPAQGTDPRQVARRDLEALEQGGALRARQVGRDGGGGQPLLGELLRLPVEGRDDRVAPGLDGVRALVAEDPVELRLDLPGELRGAQRPRLVAGEDDRRRELCLQLVRRQRGPAGARGQATEDPVRADDRRAVCRDDQPALAVLLGVAVRVEGGR